MDKSKKTKSKKRQDDEVEVLVTQLNLQIGMFMDEGLTVGGDESEQTDEFREAFAGFTESLWQFTETRRPIRGEGDQKGSSGIAGLSVLVTQVEKRRSFVADPVGEIAVQLLGGETPDYKPGVKRALAGLVEVTGANTSGHRTPEANRRNFSRGPREVLINEKATDVMRLAWEGDGEIGGYSQPLSAGCSPRRPKWDSCRSMQLTVDGQPLVVGDFLNQNKPLRRKVRARTRSESVSDSFGEPFDVSFASLATCPIMLSFTLQTVFSGSTTKEQLEGSFLLL